ncbi:site-specific DNA-methyltransferase [Mycoplasma sp. 6243]|uniref:site-specific DNA-methyltransferase n=1 Tax=Mycoplasma sp. 6243 TaxID=3440865 RepID=UPI003EBC48A3
MNKTSVKKSKLQKNLDELKKQEKARIDELSSTEFNQDQKEIAKEIIDNITNPNRVQYISQFIIQRVKMGFTFDAAPESDSKTIAILRKDDQLSFNFDNKQPKDQNTLIIGENYDALKNLILIERYRQRNGLDFNYDVIYIDPPYNTESSLKDGNKLANDKENIAAKSFSYRDKFTQNGWLNMMNERLQLARALLKDDGVIFVSIDNNEQAYLKVLMDEIFGEGNFVDSLVWKSVNSVLKQSKLIRNDHEYILLYAKKISEVVFLRQKNTMNFQNPDNDPKGNWFSSNAASPNQNSDRNKFPISLPGGKECIRNWKFSYDDYKNGTVSLYFNGNNVPRLKIYESEYNINSKVQSSIFENLGSLTSAKREIESILDKNSKFQTPKPTTLIKHILKLLNKNSRVLDFYAGSGTTGHAVLELNREDGGNRTFTLVTNNENNIGIDVNYKRLRRINTNTDLNGNEINCKWYQKNESYNSNLNVYWLNEKEDYINIGLESSNNVKDLKEKWLSLIKNFGIDNSKFDYDELLTELLTLKPYKKND